ncbi:MAG: DUF4831 family protein [Mucinivorans sp.]
MKKLLTLAAILLLSAGASAQIAAYPQGNSAAIEGYTLPRTIVTVRLTQEREVIIRGPYARYAAQYLGITGAAQSDKESFKLLGAALGYAEEPDPAQTFVFDEKSGAPLKIFRWLTVKPVAADAAPSDMDYDGARIGNRSPFTDVSATPLIYGQTSENVDMGLLIAGKVEAIEKSTEQMAADAAALIFKLRKRRVELICAEQGENVFGAGLGAALSEMDRLEKEYLSLFVGKRYTQVTSITYSVLPEVGKNRVVPCRFSEQKGVVAPSELSARPLTLEFTPLQSGTLSVAPKRSASRAVVIRVPQSNQVRLYDGQDVLATEWVPVFQLGTTMDAPVL